MSNEMMRKETKTTGYLMNTKQGEVLMNGLLNQMRLLTEGKSSPSDVKSACKISDKIMKSFMSNPRMEQEKIDQKNRSLDLQERRIALEEKKFESRFYKKAIDINAGEKDDEEEKPYLADHYACMQLCIQFNKSEFSSRDKNIMPSEIELRCIPEYEPLADAIIEKHGGFKKFAEKSGFVYQS